MNIKSKSILPICLLFSFTACQNVEHPLEEKRTSTSELDQSDTLLDDSNDSERSNPQGKGNQDDLTSESILSLPSGYYKTDCIIIGTAHSMKISLEIRTTSFPDNIDRTYTFYTGTSCNTALHTAFITLLPIDDKPNLGNNTSYFTSIPPSYVTVPQIQAYPFHIDDDGALYIGYNSSRPSLLDPILEYFGRDLGDSTGYGGGGFILNSSSIVEDVFADFINNPTSGFKYIPIL